MTRTEHDPRTTEAFPANGTAAGETAAANGSAAGEAAAANGSAAREAAAVSGQGRTAAADAGTETGTGVAGDPAASGVPSGNAAAGSPAAGSAAAGGVAAGNQAAGNGAASGVASGNPAAGGAAAGGVAPGNPTASDEAAGGVAASGAPANGAVSGSGGAADVEGGVPDRSAASLPEPPAPKADLASIDDVEEAMRDVVDPELGINVVDLGLVYDIRVDEQNTAVLDMTLTSAACPLTDVIEDQARSALVTGPSGGIVEDVKINWVWMPPWGPEKITEDGREQLRALGFTV